MNPKTIHAETARGWNLIATGKYREEMHAHLERLRTGGHAFHPPEMAVLGPLLPGLTRTIHLQCSNGYDTLALLNLGAREVVGIDISEEMIRQAREMTTALGARADWFCVDILDTPRTLDGSADLVYTSCGSICWIMDLAPWAAVVKRLLRPGGHLFLFDGHPLLNLWDREASEPRLREDGTGYFDQTPQENPGYPSDALTRIAGERHPRVLERTWRPGQVLAALHQEGLDAVHFDEYPVLFWNQFPAWPEGVRARLPNSYAILARRGA